MLPLLLGGNVHRNGERLVVAGLEQERGERAPVRLWEDVAQAAERLAVERDGYGLGLDRKSVV